MQEALRSRQGHMDRLNESYRDLAISSRQVGANIPENVQHRVDKLNVDWLKVQQMSNNLRPTSGDHSVFSEGEHRSLAAAELDCLAVFCLPKSDPQQLFHISRQHASLHLPAEN